MGCPSIPQGIDTSQETVITTWSLFLLQHLATPWRSLLRSGQTAAERHDHANPRWAGLFSGWNAWDNARPGPPAPRM